MLKVLIVDDEPYVIEGLKVMVDWADNGYVICGEASNGIEALELVKKCNPDLIITDIRMPGMDGLELIRHCSEILRSTAKFVILSGYDEFCYVKEAMKYNTKEYLLKPLDDEEINSLITRLAAEIHEERNRAQNTNRQIAFVANQCIRRVISGEKKESLTYRLGLLLDIGRMDTVQCLLVEISNGNILQTDNFSVCDERKKVARHIMEEELGSNSQFNIFEDHIDRLGIICCSKMLRDRSIVTLANDLFLKLKAELGNEICISLSSEEKGAEALYEIYRMADYALEFRFYKGKDKIITYEEIKDIQISSQITTEKYKPLLLFIRANQCDDLQKNIQELFEDFIKNNVLPRIVVSSVKSFLLEAAKLLIDLNVNLKDFMDTALVFDKYMEQMSVYELQKAFFKECVHAAELIENSKCNSSQLVIFEVKDYIQQNFFKDIKLKKVAQEFYMNPVYLGQVFRKATGMQFNDYLNSVRIEEAKKLLRQTDMKITEISKAVGFNDPKYFLSKFKSVTNLPPSAFKTE